MLETILIVDDEEAVCRTFRDWLVQADLACTIKTAADAEAALRIANAQPIDLAILDWNLGAGDDGLQLLQDLAAFHPDVVAILVTGFANQATPLDAMRMGVRDYLDKNHDLNREAFLRAVRRQLDAIRPAKRVRQLHQSLVAFRAAIEKVLPLVQSAAVLTEPVPLPDAIRVLVRFLIQTTRARDGVLVVRHFDRAAIPNDSSETCQVFDAAGERLDVPLVPFARSVAGAVVGLGQPSLMNDLTRTDASLEWQPFERGRRALLAIPLPLAPGTQAVIELFDPPAGFTAADQQLAQAAGDLGTELLRQALGQRQTQRLLFDAVQAALDATEEVSQSLTPAVTVAASASAPVPEQVVQSLREGLSETGDPATAALNLDLAEAIRVLGTRHGPLALEHCLHLIRQVRTLLDRTTAL